MHINNSSTALLRKWAPLVESTTKKIENKSTKLAMAQVFENTMRDFVRHGLVKEATGTTNGTGNDVGTGPVLGNIKGFGSGDGVMKGNFGMNASTYGDNYLPNLVMPVLRRIFPDLIAHDLCGVQPLTGPIGFAVALRAKYGANPQFDNTATTPSWEIGGPYGAGNVVDSRFTGISSDVSGLNGELNGELSAYAGDSAGDAFNAYFGTGAETYKAEFAKLGSNYPEASFDLVKSGVEAKTRKLAAHWSPELAEDLEAMHGINVETEMVNILSYEIGAEIDRQIISEMAKSAIQGGITKWNPTQADGLDQMGRLATLLTEISLCANDIAISTHRGQGNFVVASPTVTALLEQLGMNKFVGGIGSKKLEVPTSSTGSIQKYGLINDGQQLLVRDAFARKNYAIVGYKGVHAGDSGIIFCPYIPVQLTKVMQPDSFTPSVGARTRYGLLNNPWDAKNFYRFVAVEGINETYTGGFNATAQFTFRGI